MCSSFHKMYIVTITSSINSWLGTADRLFIATSIPSWSNPLYTSPNLPWPIKLLSLKPFVAKDNSSMWKGLASCEVNSTPAFFPTASDSDYLRNWENKYEMFDLIRSEIWPWTDGSEDPVSEVVEIVLLRKIQKQQMRSRIPTNATAPAAPPTIAARVLDIWRPRALQLQRLGYIFWHIEAEIWKRELILILTLYSFVMKPKATKTLTKSSISAIK